MTRLVAAELLKLRTTRTFWALTGSAAALVLLIVVLSLILDDALDDEVEVEALLATGGIGGLMTLVLGVVAAAGEYRHGTIASTLLVTPQRLRAVSASVIACLLGGVFIGIAISAAIAVVALPWLSATGADLMPLGETLELFGGAILFAALGGALGAGLGALLRNQVAAVVSVLVLIFVLDPTLSALVEDAAPYTLSGLSSSLTGGDDGGIDTLSRGVAALVWLGYTAVLAGAAAFLTSRRDI
jgi:hypothetical protein